MVVDTPVIAALNAYRIKLREMGQPARAAVVAHCIVLVKRLTNLQTCRHGADPDADMTS
jgi:hypothetical protein